MLHFTEVAILNEADEGCPYLLSPLADKLNLTGLDTNRHSSTPIGPE